VGEGVEEPATVGLGSTACVAVLKAVGEEAGVLVCVGSSFIVGVTAPNSVGEGIGVSDVRPIPRRPVGRGEPQAACSNNKPTTKQRS